MKRRLLMIGMSALLMMGLSAFSAAQEQQAPPQGGGQGQGRGGMMRMSPEERTNRMAEMLNLTDDQKAKVKKIYEEAPGMDKMRDMSPEDRRAAMEATNEKIKAVLTDEQKKKYDDMMQRMRQRGPGGPGGEGGQKPPSQ